MSKKHLFESRNISLPNLKVLCQTPKVLILLSLLSFFSLLQINVNFDIITYILPAKIVL